MRSIPSSMLVADFTPGDHHIIIGRGRAVKMHTANVKFDKMIASIARTYQDAPSKSQKGIILSKLIAEIHAPSATAGFVKKDPETGRWHSVEESLARTTSAQAIRNYLSGDYRSSKQYKQKRRIQQIQQMQMSAASPTMSPAVPSHCISPYSSDEEDSAPSQSSMAYTKNTTAAQSVDTFSVLFSAFSSVASADPFSPTPLFENTAKKSEQALPSNSLTSLLSMSMTNWEPTPLTAINDVNADTEDWMASLIQDI